MLVAEATQLPRETLTARVDMARTRHRHAEPTLSAHRQPTLLVIGERPVGIALLIGEGDNMNRFFMAGPCMKVTASNGVDMRDSSTVIDQPKAYGRLDPTPQAPHRRLAFG